MILPNRIRMALALLTVLAMATLLPPGQIRSAPLEPSRPLYQPLILKDHASSPAMVELRGLWVSRFDWTNSGQAADPAKIDEIVENAAGAGFNALFFQVRAVADAYYASELEPWAGRVSGGTLGQAPDPLWDPLAYFVEKAHGAGLQLHAWINVYPVATGGGACDDIPDPTVLPTPLYHQLIAAYGGSQGQPNALQWLKNGALTCTSYRFVSPAAPLANDHIVAVAKDLITRYDIDGLHLDNIRYVGPGASCDPVSLCRYQEDEPLCDTIPACSLDADYQDWQRQQINELVERIYQTITALDEDVWLTAAVWPVYQDSARLDLPGHPLEGYDDFYQDSKAWVAGGYIDSIMPMIYPSRYHCPDDSYWTRTVWAALASDFQRDSNGRFIIPSIGSGYCTFDEIEARIEKAREIGVAGHALFSYRGLLQNGYFDDLPEGPYQMPAIAPAMPAPSKDAFLSTLSGAAAWQEY